MEQHAEIQQDAFIKEVVQAMRDTRALNRQTYLETARQVCYRHGIAPTLDDLQAITLKARRVLAPQYSDTGI